MSITGIGPADCWQTEYEKRMAGKRTQRKAVKETAPMPESFEEIRKSKTQTDIVVKPDGSRVLVVTMDMGGMETTMSLEISKPTDMDNGSGKAFDPGQIHPMARQVNIAEAESLQLQK